MSKAKSVDLGTVRKGKNGPYFTFDTSIKKVQITREFQGKDGTVTQVLEVPLNEKGYLESAFISKIDDYFSNKVDRNFMTAEKAESAKKKLAEKGVSSIFQVKVK
jgi:hypothetical protein